MQAIADRASRVRAREERTADRSEWRGDELHVWQEREQVDPEGRERERLELQLRRAQPADPEILVFVLAYAIVEVLMVNAVEWTSEVSFEYLRQFQQP